MASLYKKTHTIFCVDCGRKRKVYGPNHEQVKRCKPCQYDQKRKYNSEYVKKQRRKNREAKI